MNKPAETSATEQAVTPQFNLLRQYVKDLSVEFPSAPNIFKTKEETTLDLEMNSESNKVEEGIYEVSLFVTLTIRNSENKTVLIVECKQAGLFEILHVSPAELDILLNVHALEILFPFLRETVSNLSMRTSLPPILLPPTNFVQFYQQRRAAQEGGETTPEPEKMNAPKGKAKK